MNTCMIAEKSMKHYYLKRKISKTSKTWKILLIKIMHTQKLGEYYDLYVQSDTLLLAALLKNFRNMRFEINELCKIIFQLFF